MERYGLGMLRVNQVKVKEEHTRQDLCKKTADMLRIPVQEFRSLSIVRQSVDARKKPEIFYSYTVDVELPETVEDKVLRKNKGRLQISKADTVKYRFPEAGENRMEHPPVIVGMGPAGLFCAYYLALHGYKPVLLDRGKCVEERQRGVESFWETGAESRFQRTVWRGWRRRVFRRETEYAGKGQGRAQQGSAGNLCKVRGKGKHLL